MARDWHLWRCTSWWRQYDWPPCRVFLVVCYGNGPLTRIMCSLMCVGRTLASVKISKLKGAIWSADMSHVALFSKHGRISIVSAECDDIILHPVSSFFFSLNMNTLCNEMFTHPSHWSSYNCLWIALKDNFVLCMIWQLWFITESKSKIFHNSVSVLVFCSWVISL